MLSLLFWRRIAASRLLIIEMMGIAAVTFFTMLAPTNARAAPAPAEVLSDSERGFHPAIESGNSQAIQDNSRQLRKEGRRVFRFETFGDEAWWTDTLRLHEAIEGSKLGGVG
jgi:hypothetical protein